MTDPPPSQRCFQAGLVVWKTMSSSTRITCRHRSSVISANGAKAKPAALL